jgi:hypothetical protein
MKTKQNFIYKQDIKEYIIVLKEKKCFFCRKKVPEIPEKPKENCRAFFSGGVVAGHYEAHGISEVYVEDNMSEYVGAGLYPDNEKAFPKAVAFTFDGIAIDAGTRVKIYKKKKFKGRVLLNKKGPAIINNNIWKKDPRYQNCLTEIFDDSLQKNFPPKCRKWSKTNMHAWSYGSLKVICE